MRRRIFPDVYDGTGHHQTASDPGQDHCIENNYLGMVREYQHYTYKDHYSVVDLSGSPDLEKLSAAYDIPYLRLNNMEHVDEVLDTFLAEDNTMLLECLIDPMDLVK